MPATWVKPKLVCEIKFQEWTQENRMRVPVFMGLRTDKKTIEVKKEKEMPVKKIQNSGSRKQSLAKTEKTYPGEKKIPKSHSATGKLKKTSEWVNEEEENPSLKLNGHVLNLTNLNKIYWKT